MESLYIERRSLAYGMTISSDIAHHLYTRQFEGTVLVIADAPFALLSAVRKQWHKVLRQVLRERSATLNTARIHGLNFQIAHMQQLRFALVNPHKPLPAVDVYFASPELLHAFSAKCHTMYLAARVDDDGLSLLSERVVHHGLLVMYET